MENLNFSTKEAVDHGIRILLPILCVGLVYLFIYYYFFFPGWMCSTNFKPLVYLFIISN